MTIIINKVWFGYPDNPVFVDLTTSIPASVVTAVVGENGCGKSTLLALIAGVLRPRHGTVDVPAAQVALAVQRSQVSDTFPITVAEAVEMGRWRRLGLLRRPSRRDRDVVGYWMSEFGLDELENRRLGDLSGGQRQRVLLAQAFAQEAAVLLLDEPTTGLDAAGAEVLDRQLRRLAAVGTTIVVATHDTELVTGVEHRIVLDQKGLAASDAG